MASEDLKEIICRIIETLRSDEEISERQTPVSACIFKDNPCDVATLYAVGEES